MPVRSDLTLLRSISICLIKTFLFYAMMPSGKGLNTHYLFASYCKIDEIPEHKTEFIDPIIYQCDQNLMIAFLLPIFLFNSDL